MALPLLGAGCGSSSSAGSSGTTSTAAGTSTAHATQAWTGLGAKLADWESAHPRGTEKCSAGECFGSQEEVAPGEFEYQFHGVETTPEGRVDNYEQSLGGSDLIPAAAEQAALAMLPNDARVISSEVSHENGSCKLITVQSHTLGRWFANPKAGDASGVVSIDIHGTSPESESTYPAHLSEASVSLGHGAPGC